MDYFLSDFKIKERNRTAEVTPIALWELGTSSGSKKAAGKYTGRFGLSECKKTSNPFLSKPANLDPLEVYSSLDAPLDCIMA